MERWGGEQWLMGVSGCIALLLPLEEKVRHVLFYTQEFSNGREPHEPQQLPAH